MKQWSSLECTWSYRISHEKKKDIFFLCTFRWKKQFISVTLMGHLRV